MQPQKYMNQAVKLQVTEITGQKSATAFSLSHALQTILWYLPFPNR